MDPADSFEFESDIEAVRSGSLEWFRACVGVFRGQELVGYDCLGGCAYVTARDFIKGENRNDYFRDMVREALRAAGRERSSSRWL
jgi:hypothetical protein